MTVSPSVITNDPQMAVRDIVAAIEPVEACVGLDVQARSRAAQKLRFGALRF